jgi:hypothetical protein
LKQSRRYVTLNRQALTAENAYAVTALMMDSISRNCNYCLLLYSAIPMTRLCCSRFVFSSINFLIVSMGWDYASLKLRPLTGPLSIPQIIMIEYAISTEWYWQGKTEGLGENPIPLPLCQPQSPHGQPCEPRPPREEAATNVRDMGQPNKITPTTYVTRSLNFRLYAFFYTTSPEKETMLTTTPIKSREKCSWHDTIAYSIHRAI